MRKKGGKKSQSYRLQVSICASKESKVIQFFFPLWSLHLNKIPLHCRMSGFTFLTTEQGELPPELRFWCSCFLMSSLADLPPPLSFISILAIIVVYLIICYLVIDFVSQNSDRSSLPDVDGGNLSRFSLQELQEIPCFYHKAESESTCLICLDSLQNAQLCRAFPACNHVFHAECIDPWLSKRLTCPACRAPFRTH